MPPVAKAGGTQFRKDVEFAETKDSDEYELEATGIVMVPDKADLQNDFAREETIQSFTEQFETFEEAGQAGGGIMHAVWPDGWMELTRNEVLDESEEINGKEVQPGVWVQRWGIDNAELAALVDDNILEGYSIGAIQVDWEGPFEPDEVDDVDTSEIPDGELVWELTDGIIREVSAVDIPAVPDAQILEAKGLDKRLAEHVGNQDAFIEEAMERGHSEAEAERLWDVLNAAVEADGSAEPGKQSVFARAGKAFLSALTGDDSAPTVAETPDEDPRGSRGAAKEGRTLSTANRESLYATIDASLDVLEDAGEVPEDMTRFTDRDDTDFDLSEHQAREWGGDHDDEDEEEDESTPPGVAADADTDPDEKDAPGGDTPDDTTDMSDTDDPMEDAPEWAKTLHDDVQENSTRIEEQGERLEAALEEPAEEKTAQIEIGGEIYEVTESEAKSWFEDGEEPDSSPMDDAPDYVRALNDRVEEVNQRIERINEQSGTSDQLDAAATSGGQNGDGGNDDPLKEIGEALS